MDKFPGSDHKVAEHSEHHFSEPSGAEEDFPSEASREGLGHTPVPSVGDHAASLRVFSAEAFYLSGSLSCLELL